jgi:hypothetical protein
MRSTLAATLLSLLVACGSSARQNTGDAGPNAGDGGNNGTNCAATGVDLVYVVSQANEFMSFDPTKLPSQSAFTNIATLNCPSTLPPADPNATGPSAPFSMSVDRQGTAWVLYNSGEIFKVAITTGACSASGYVPLQNNMSLFGMGFVTDSMGANTEKLYIAGGDVSPVAGGKLAVIDTTVSSPMPTILGTISATAENSPELTGTSEGKLYGFYPGVTNSFVQEIARSGSGAGGPAGTAWPLTGGLGGTVSAWAFAQWGGKFYIFVTTGDGVITPSNSTVRVIDKATGAYSTPLQNLPYQIVGAGVSTCAPIVIGKTSPQP